MNLTDFQQIELHVQELNCALSNYANITEDISHPALFHAHCGGEGKKMMVDACREIATKDATEQIKKAREQLQLLGVEIGESDIKERLAEIQDQRKAFRDMQKLLIAETSPAVN